MAKPNPSIKKLEDMPLVLTPTDIINVFGVSMTTAQELWFEPNFPGYRIGRQKFVTRDALAVYMKVPEASIPNEVPQIGSWVSTA